MGALGGVGKGKGEWRDCGRRQGMASRWREGAGQVREVRMINRRSDGSHGITWTDAYSSIICQL